MEEFIKVLLVNLFGDNIEVREATNLEETVPLMLSDDYKKRLLAEYKQTLYRYNKLTRYIRKLELGECEAISPVKLLAKQHKIMRSYLEILLDRCTLEGIDING